jgi:Ca2+-binding RTX toxin-like protein
MSVTYVPVGITVNGTDNADTLNGGSGDDTIIGNAGNDVIRGYSTTAVSPDGNDSMSGGAGNDSFYGGVGDDTIDGGTNDDRLYYYTTGVSGLSSPIDHISFKSQFAATTSPSFAVTKYDSANVVLGVDTVTAVESFYGTLNADTFASGDPRIRNFWVSGMGGSDTFTQTPYGVSPFDASYVPNYRTNGMQVSYWWVAPKSGSNEGIKVTWSGATGQVQYFDSTTTSPSGNASQKAGTDTLSYITGLEDSNYDDTFDFSGYVLGFQGFATRAIDGKSTHWVNLRGGSDTIIGNGNTGIYFTSANNLTNASGKTGGVTIDLKLAQADLSNISGYGTLKYSGIEQIGGTKFADTLIGGVTANNDFESFRGEGGNDTIDGGSGFDRAVYSNATEAISVVLPTKTADGTVTGGASVGTDTLRNIESITATDFADTLDARNYYSAYSTANDFMPGGGDDIIYGSGNTRVNYENALVAVKADVSSGADALNASDKTASDYYSLGKDTYNGGISGLIGSNLSDMLIGSANGDGNLLAEYFRGNGGNDTIDGSAGWDWAGYTTSPYAIVVDMTKSSNQVQDGWGNTDTLIGIEGIEGSHLADRMRGSDVTTLTEGFMGSKGADSIDGGAGFNKADYINDPTGVVVWLAAKGATTAPTAALTDVLQAGYTGVAKDGWGDVDQLANIQGAEGSAYDDTLIGNELSNRLDGRAGNDSLDGGAGFDWAEYNNSPAGVSVDLSALAATNDGWGGNDRLVGIEAVQGSTFADALTGDTAANQLDGLDGNDTISGGDGNDTINGGLGNDSMDGGTGDDVIAGNDGDDVIKGGQGRDYLLGGAGNDSLVLSPSGTWSSSYRAQSDFLVAASVQSSANKLVALTDMNRFETVSNGGDGTDSISLTSGNDALFVDDAFSQLNAQAAAEVGRLIAIESIDAGAGNDLIDLTTIKFALAGFTVLGGTGNDTIWGGQGTDSINGGDGTDMLLGGAGNDTLTGGAGNDVFLFATGSGQDSITDFATGDKVRLLGGTGSGAVATHTATDTVLAWGGIQVTLTGIKLATDNSTNWFEYVA